MGTDPIEAVTSHLRARLGGTHVSASVPASRQRLAALVTVCRAGGTRSPFLDEPRMACDCYAGSVAESYGLAERVADAVCAMPEGHPTVSSAGPCTIYRNEWAEDGTPCHTVTFPMVINA